MWLDRSRAIPELWIGKAPGSGPKSLQYCIHIFHRDIGHHTMGWGQQQASSIGSQGLPAVVNGPPDFLRTAVRQNSLSRDAAIERQLAVKLFVQPVMVENFWLDGVQAGQPDFNQVWQDLLDLPNRGFANRRQVSGENSSRF